MATVVVQPREDVRKHIANMNKRRRAPGITDAIRESLPPVFIFNIYNREHQVSLGSYGFFRIPACPVGQKFAGPVAYGGKPYIQGLLANEYDLGTGLPDGQMGVTWVHGKDVARDVLGIGSAGAAMGLYTTDKTNWGCFISEHATKENPVPSDAEIAAAREKLTATMLLWFENGQQLAKEGKLGAIGPNHREAAAFLNQKVEWSAKAIPMENCPVCQEPVRPGTMKHSCGAILDPQGALEAGIINRQTFDEMAAAKARRQGAAQETAAPAVEASPAPRPSGPVPGQPIRRQ